MSNPLLKDLSDLVEKNIITADTALQITAYYDNKKNTGHGRFSAVLAILGALLVGSGIVLVIAHNWDMLNRLTRTIIAFTPLVLAQALCLYALLRKTDHRAWKESTAVLLFFAVATSISLTAQIYHVNGSLSEFLLTWALLMIPVIFIMNSGMVSLMTIVLATWYATETGYTKPAVPFQYIALMALILIHFYSYCKKANSNFFHWHNWFIAISVLVVLGTFVQNGYDNYQWAFIGYMGLVSIYYIVGNSRLMSGQRWFSNPYRLLGALGIITIFMTWTFDEIWMSFNISSQKEYIKFNNLFAYISLALLAFSGLLIVRLFRDLMAFSAFIFAGAILFFYHTPYFGILIFNLWVLAIGLHYIRKGIQRDHLGFLNFGLLIIALLATLRFFDSDIPFMWRGLIFICSGLGFFVANYLFIRKRRSAKNITQ